MRQEGFTGAIRGITVVYKEGLTVLHFDRRETGIPENWKYFRNHLYCFKLQLSPDLNEPSAVYRVTVL